MRGLFLSSSLSLTNVKLKSLLLTLWRFSGGRNDFFGRRDIAREEERRKEEKETETMTGRRSARAECRPRKTEHFPSNFPAELRF